LTLGRCAILCVVLAPFACTFPDVDVVASGGGGVGGATATTTAASTASTTASTASSSTAATGMGGSGGFDLCDVDDDGIEAVSCGGEDCDDDGDTYDSTDPACTGEDCDDADARAHPMQMEPQPTPRASGGWDFNCDDDEVPEFSEVCDFCPGQYLAGVPAGPAGCGVPGNRTECDPVVAPKVCSPGDVIENNVVQRCL
jgi:hypothetical protein